MKNTSFTVNKFLIIVFLLSVGYKAKSQDLQKLYDSLQLRYTKATTVDEKIEALYDIGSRFNTPDPAKRTDAVEKIIYLGESTRDKNIIGRSYRYAAIIYSTNQNDKANMDKAFSYGEKSLAVAKEISGNTADKFSVYASFSRINRTLNKNEQAIRYANEAVTIADELGDDSLRIIGRIALSLSQLSSLQKIEAFKSLLAAQTITEEFKEGKRKTNMLLRVYQSMATFFTDIKNYEKAIDYQYKIVAIYQAEKQVTQEIAALESVGYTMIGAKKIDAAKKVFESILEKADKDKSISDLKINGNIGLINCLLESEKPEEGLTYFLKHPDIELIFTKYNLTTNFAYAKAFLFTAANKFDSAKFYYDKSFDKISQTTALNMMPNTLYQYSYFFYKTKQYPKAIALLKSAAAINDSLKKSTDNIEYYKYMDSCYQNMGDKSNSLYYKNMVLEQTKILDEMNKEKDVLGLEIDAENKRKERAEITKAEETRKRHNWQYMGILVVILSLFTVLASFGIFKVSERLIKILGFVAFILLFEFIILIADTWIHHATHGEPWKILAIKVVLIGLLLPLHHYLEHKAVQYITSKQNRSAKV